MSRTNNLTVERLKELLSYDPLTGAFTWRDGAGHHTRAGLAGAIDAKGYRRIGIERVFYKAHRLAWLYVYAAHPAGLIDHIDGDRDNNRIANLRQASAEQSAANTGGRNGNPFKGASFDAQRGVWVAQIQTRGKNKHIGRFRTAEEAHAAYCAKAREISGEFAKY